MIGRFQGALLDSRNPGEIVAPSLAMVDEEVWSRTCARNPNNILYVMPETYPWDPEAVPTARSKSSEVLAAEYREMEGWFAYRVEDRHHGQTGLVCLIDARAYPGLVRPHEEVRETVVPAVAANYQAVGLSVNPVSLMTRSTRLADWLETETAAHMPVVDFVAEDGTSEKVWELPEPPPAVIDEIAPTYIADGHHRAAAAAQLADHGAASSFMAVVYPANQMRILGFHRLVHGADPAAIAELHAIGQVSSTPPVPARHEVAVCHSGEWDLLVLAGPDESRLDPELLQDELLAPMFGIVDPANDRRLEFVPGNTPLDSLAAKLDPGDVAFVTRPVTVEAVLAIADAGRTVPPKSTWFSPKARAGLFVQHIGGG